MQANKIYKNIIEKYLKIVL